MANINELNINNDNTNEELNEKRYPYHCNWKSCDPVTTNSILLYEHLDENHLSITTNNEKVLGHNLSQQFDHSIVKPDQLELQIQEIKTIVDNSQENRLNHVKMIDESFNCAETGCDFIAKTSIELHSHLLNNHRINHTITDDNDGNNQETINGNSCTFPECQYLAQDLIELKNHLLSKHKIDGKVYVDINKSLKDDAEDQSRRDNESYNELGRKSLKCYVKGCDYKGKNSHGLRIHLLQKHNIKKNSENMNTSANDIRDYEVIKLTSKSCNCSVPKCQYVGKNIHGLRVHYNRAHAMHVLIKTDFKINNQVNKLIDKPIDKPVDKPTDKPIDESPIVTGPPKANIPQLTTTPNDNNSNSFRCTADDCDYESPKFNSLRSHMVRKHKMFCKKDVQGNRAEVKQQGIVQKIFKRVQRKVYECKQNGCEYVGQSPLGLRVHLKQKHGIRVNTNSLNATNISHAQNGLKTNATNEENKLFKCSLPHCEYVGKSLVGLRFHKRNKHHIKHHFQPFQTHMTQAGTSSRIERANKLKRKYASRINVNNDKNQISYRLKRKYTKRQDNNNQVSSQVEGRIKRKYTSSFVVNNRDKNQDLVRSTYGSKQRYTTREAISDPKINRTAVPLKRAYTRRIIVNDSIKNQDLSQKSDRLKRKYTRCSVGNQNNNQSNTGLKRKYRKPVNINHEDINRELLMRVKHGYNKRVTSNTITNVIKRKYTRPSIGQRLATFNSVRSTLNTNSAIKRKFKCQFPGCDFLGVDAEQLKQHVQCIHKNNPNIQNNCQPINQNLFKCYFPDCTFIGYTSIVLKEHIASQHSHNLELIQNCSFKLYKCKFPNCHFPGSLTLKGLRIHTNRNHSSSPNTVPKAQPKLFKALTGKLTIGNHFNQIQRSTTPQNRNTQIIETNFNNRNIMVFKCSYIDCSFSVANLGDLRHHISTVHQN